MPSTPAKLSRILPYGLVGLALLTYWVMVVTASSRVGLTFDEAGHITAGYAADKFGDFRLDAEGGLLTDRVAGATLLNLPLRYPIEQPSWQLADARQQGLSFFYESGNDFDRMLVRGRLAAGLLGIGVVWLTWRWARGLFGSRSGWLALGLAVFSPTLLAHGGLGTADIAITFCLLLALSACWLLLHRITWLRLIGAGLATGMAILAKMSGLILLPMVAGLAVVRFRNGAPLVVALGTVPRRFRGAGSVGAALAALGMAGLIAVLTIWTAYEFRFAAMSSGFASPEPNFSHKWPIALGEAQEKQDAGVAMAYYFRSDVGHAGTATRVIRFARDHRLLPEAFLWGLAYTLNSLREQPSFIAGTIHPVGSSWFFPIAFGLKSTPVELLCFLCGVGMILSPWLWRRRSPDRSSGRKRWLYRLAPVGILFFGYWAMILRSGLNIGHRHLLPIYPCVFIVASAAVLWLPVSRRPWPRLMLGALLGLNAIDSLAARPFYLSYFTPLAGGSSRGWKYLVDSSYDWGQGLPDLAAWLKAKKQSGDDSPVFLTYFGSDSPRARRLPVKRFGDWRDDQGFREFPVSITGGWFAISATHFSKVCFIPEIAGAWSEDNERKYWSTWETLPKQPSDIVGWDAAKRERWEKQAKFFEVLQFLRLRHFLRNREPDAIVGASLLLFHLNDEEVNLAINVPLTQLEPASDNRRFIAP